MTQTTAGAALIARLGQLGVTHIFANSGTDFPPIIEGLAASEGAGSYPLPKPVLCPHEMAAISMAQGAFLASGQAQAVMVHTNVGLANVAIGALNARASNVPVLLFSGRTPTLEHGRFGARTVPIGWGQEMFDQTALVREPCKWDYELRYPEQVADMADRAMAIATSIPRGPVYMSLPREVLCENADIPDARVQMQPAAPVAAPEDIEAAAALLAGAQRPIIIAQRGAGSANAFDALSKMTEQWAIPLCQYWAVQLALATDHPMATGPDPDPWIRDADVVLVLDALAPWAPDKVQISPETRVIHLGQDPLFGQTPMRNFRTDLALAGDVGANVLALCAAMARREAKDVEPRRARTTQANASSWQSRRAEVASDRAAGRLTKRVISAQIAHTAGQSATVFSELGAQLPYMALSKGDSWFESPHSGGLGFGLPAAMGFAMTRPGKLVFAAVGDGSYMFANPVACHHIAKAHDISIVVIVLNNSEWGAVRAATVDLYPNGKAASANVMPLTDLAPSPDFTKVAQASSAWARRVESCEDFEAALQEAMAHVQAGKGLALIDAIIGRD